MKTQLLLLKKIRQMRPVILVLLVVVVLLEVLNSFLGIYLMSLLVSLVVAQVEVTYLVQVMSAYVLLMMVVLVAHQFMKDHLAKNAQTIRMKTIAEVTNTMIYFDYQLFEDEEVLALRDQAFETSNSSDSLFEIYPAHLRDFLSIFLQIIFYSSLFFLLNKWLMGILLFMLVILSIYRKYQNMYWLKTKPEMDRVSEKLNYMDRVSGRFSMAKDMRLYGVKNWFKEIQEDLLHQRQQLHGKRLRVLTGGNFLAACFTIVLTALGYWSLINEVVRGYISIDELVFLMAALTQVTNLTTRLVDVSGELIKDGREFEIYQQYVQLPQLFNHQKGSKLEERDIEIRFDQVSFTYPNATKPVFEDLSFTISKNEKCALVGLNGSGKTTLVKLLCNLYKPDHGRILINGVDNQAFNVFDYYDLFSAVFQDTHIWPYTIRQLIVQGKAFDQQKYEEVLRLSGFKPIVEQLQKKDESLIASTIDKEAVALSGGQLQKLKLAQALYKDGPILILDEPTAALDPLAENEIYRNYFELARKKTSIFITHRLASTQFCDRILFLEDGKITETGTHRELMQQRGHYFEMYEKQAYYYRQKGGHHV